ncbi:hypothetical protein KEJ17_08580 [Candidatus Bathyarchaeota archaeon]|nr:hypothetical protein [Candidatus Bathyarchaeota archaeon]
MTANSFEIEVKNKIKYLGKLMGFEVEEEWAPSTLKEKSRKDFYIPRIDLVWFKRGDPKFIKFLERFRKQGVLDPYRDIEKEVVIGFELELTDRQTKYILGDISNLSRLCDYGFIVIKNVENLVERSVKASRAFSILHGASNVFVIDPKELDNIIKQIEKEQI